MPLELSAVQCRDGSLRVFRSHEAAKSRAWEEDGDSEYDLPLFDIAIADAVEGAALPEAWVCGLWVPEWPLCAGLLEQAFRSRADALAAAAAPCPPAAIGMNAADFEALRAALPGRCKAGGVKLRVVHVQGAGQPPGELVGRI